MAFSVAENSCRTSAFRPEADVVSRNGKTNFFSFSLTKYP